MNEIENILRVVWRKKKEIITITVLLTVLVSGGSYLLTTKYTSTATLIPTGSTTGLGSLADLAGMAGININVQNQDLTLLYPEIILSEEVLKGVIYKEYTLKDGSRNNLIHIFDLTNEDTSKAFDKTLDQLQKTIKISMDKKTLLISLLYEEREPQLTADILNETITQLDFFLRKKRNTSALEQRKFIERRLREISAELAASEDALKSFREGNRMISMSPSLILKEERLIREVTINNSLFLELKKQYEMVKIEEIKNIPIINVLDKAQPASEKSFPIRKKIAGLAGLIIFLTTCAFYNFQERILAIYRKLYSIILTTTTGDVS
jgi:uncharacterized protein involved in exopolysaccharide biosynthesis